MEPGRPTVTTMRCRPTMAWRCVGRVLLLVCLATFLGSDRRRCQAQEPIPAPSPVLDPNQAGNIDLGAGDLLDFGGARGSGTVLDPNQAGNIDLRLEQALNRIETLEGHRDSLPIIRLSGFFQLDDGLFSQPEASRVRIGDAPDGVSFRRTRLQAFGKLTEFTNYSIMMDFAQAGRPSFMDVWGEQEQIPFFGTIRIGQFRQPGTMESWTSIRHFQFLERSVAFQALEPFRRVGIMAYSMTEDERTEWAYSIYATGLTFWNGTETVYSTIGDNRNGAQVGDDGGVAFASRITHLAYYDDLAEDRYLLHVGAGYRYGTTGGSPDTDGAFAKTYRSAAFPEFYIGDPTGLGLTGAGTPLVVDTGRVRAEDFHDAHLELAGAFGRAHFQTEVMLTAFNQFGGPAVMEPAAYFQCGYMLTGEAIAYLKQVGAFDYTVVPYTPFFGTGRQGRIRGWGAWEVAARWSYVDLSNVNVRPENQLSDDPGPPPSPNVGNVNQTTVGVNWYWNRFAKVQFNWIRSMPNYVGYGAAPFDIYGTRFQIEF
jgi:phosphate-selective porin OprO and OprP